jgi:hypothetical protein
MRLSRFSVLTVVLALLVGACSAESGEDTSTTASSSTADPGDVSAASATSSLADETTSTTASSAAGGDLPDPCSLLTVDDILAATEVPFDEGVFNDDLSSENQAICDWSGSGDFAMVQVLIQDVDTFEGNRDSVVEVMGEVTDVEIPGVSAAYSTIAGSLIGMQVEGGYLQVSYLPSGPGTVLDETTQLATIAAGNL